MDNEKKEKLKYYLVCMITDNPDAWEIRAKESAVGISMQVEIKRDKISRKDLQFLNANLLKMQEKNKKIYKA